MSLSAESAGWRVKMQEGDTSTILKRVEDVTELLGRTAEASTEDVSALHELLEELQRTVSTISLQRVLELSGVQLANAGVELYNAPRAALSILARAEKGSQQGGEQCTSFPRYLLAVTRLVAAKIMELSLSCSEDGENRKGETKSVQFMDECVDVLRSFGRVGMLMLESASIDCEKCDEYLKMAKEAFSSSIQLWSRIGLSHLTKFKHGLELEHVVDDLWDFCAGRVRVLQLMTDHSSNSPADFRDILSSLHELKMLVPYKTAYVSSLLDLIKSVSDGYSQTSCHELLKELTEEALRIGDSLESDTDEHFPEKAAAFKQHVLGNLLRSLCATGDLDRAETCYQLIPANQDPKMLLLMSKLYIDNRQFNKAHRLLQLLFAQDNFEDSLLGARAYAQGLGFSDSGLDIYRELADNYGDAEFAINLDVACSLAFVDDKRYEAIDELKRIGSALLEMGRGDQGADRSNHIFRVRQTIFDGLQNAVNSNLHEDCLKWGDAGLAVVTTAQDKAMYSRIMSRSCLQLSRNAKALDWATRAFALEASKQSLFNLFQVTLEANLDASEGEVVRLIEQLEARDDFEVEDLLAMGNVANKLGQSRLNIQLHILDKLTQIDSCSATFPVGIALQNAARLVFDKFTQQHAEPSGNSYGENFLTYANILLQQSKRLDTVHPKERFGPSSVFEWFFRMSFDIGQSTEDSKYFTVAAAIAEQCDVIFGDDSPLKQRSQQALLAAVSSDMKKIDSLDTNQLLEVLEVINRIGLIERGDTSIAAEVMSYLVRSMIAVKLRLFDSDTKAILDLCKTTQYSASELIEIGELVVYAAKFAEASKVRRIRLLLIAVCRIITFDQVRDSYQFLAGDIFSYGLQKLAQESSMDPGQLSYLLRRLITLAETKAKTLEWFEQLIQLLDSLDIAFSELDLEWFVVKAWNTGILCYRANDTKGALHFMKLAQIIMHHNKPLVDKMGNMLDQQYQDLLRLSVSSTQVNFEANA
ncbi:hypothetical protein DVH05_012094 [Phytophthora capsici]|nr:hypothetical protein DVH05_012094 [Phytophthora capsici]